MRSKKGKPFGFRQLHEKEGQKIEIQALLSGEGKDAQESAMRRLKQPLSDTDATIKSLFSRKNDVSSTNVSTVIARVTRKLQ